MIHAQLRLVLYTGLVDVATTLVDLSSHTSLNLYKNIDFLDNVDTNHNDHVQHDIPD